MSNEEYPSPDEFQAVFGVQAKYDSDWLSYEVRFTCEDGIVLILTFSILTLEMTVQIRNKELNHLIAEIEVDRAIEIMINKKENEIITRFDEKGLRQELILSPSHRPYLRYVYISASNILRNEDMQY